MIPAAIRLSKYRSYLTVCFCCFFLSGVLHSQSNSGFAQEVEFIGHLQDNSEFRNSIYLSKKIDTTSLTVPQKDSLNYYKGWAFYNLKSLDTSAMYLVRVDPASPFGNKSMFYTANNYSYLKKYDQALAIAKQTLADTNHRQLSYLQLAGIHLLKRDYRSFDSLSSLFNYVEFSVASGQKEMVSYAKKLRSQKRKSPFVAGMLSAVVPGLGKFYAGKKGQSLSTAAACFITGIVAAENLYRGGPKSPQFIITSTIFGFFYLGNIWGSAISVKMARQSFNNKTDNEIRVSIHLPLRRIFN